MSDWTSDWSYRDIEKIMAIHPTVSELIPTILGELSAPISASTQAETAQSPHDSQALDDALAETFPPSDPIAVSIRKFNDHNFLDKRDN